MRVSRLAVAFLIIASASTNARARPDPSGLQPSPCAFAEPARAFASLRELPDGLRAGLLSLFEQFDGLAEAGAPFNATDVVDDMTLPFRRFVRAYQVRDTGFIWYERGGFASGPRMTTAHRQADGSFAFGPWGNFSGDLCAASNAYMAGVRSSSF